MPRKNSLDELRSEYAALMQDAQERYNYMKANNLETPALWEVERTQKKQFVEGFSLEDKHSFRELRREIVRAENFLKDSTSSTFGAKDFMIREGAKQYSKAFGNQWKEQYGVSYDKSRIDDEKAKQAFKLYHQLASEIQENIKQYGSENLVNALYDQVVQNWSNPFDREEKMEKLRLDMYNYLQGTVLQREARAKYERNFDEEYGILNLGRLKESKTRAEYYVKLADAFTNGNYF